MKGIYLLISECVLQGQYCSLILVNWHLQEPAWTPSTYLCDVGCPISTLSYRSNHPNNATQWVLIQSASCLHAFFQQPQQRPAPLQNDFCPGEKDNHTHQCDCSPSRKTGAGIWFDCLLHPPTKTSQGAALWKSPAVRSDYSPKRQTGRKALGLSDSPTHQ